MPIDFTAAQALATRLISENGRAITLTRESRTPADPARPWGPAAAGQTDTESIATVGVFLDLDKDALASITAAASLGQSTVNARQQQVLIPAAAALPEEVGPDWRVQDGTDVWEVVRAMPLKPASVVVFYKLEVTL